MTLHEQVTDILASAVEAQECAGISVLVRRCGERLLVNLRSRWSLVYMINFRLRPFEQNSRAATHKP